MGTAGKLIPRYVLRFAVIALVVVTISLALHCLAPSPVQRLHLGAEYFNIGRAIVDGRGFADPFGESTGPTAWMPPLYPTLLAGLIWVVGVKEHVATAVVVLMTMSTIGCAVMVGVICRQCTRRVPPNYVPYAYLFWLLAFYYWFFLLTSDVWILSLLVAVICFSITRHLTSETKIRPLAWGVLGGVAALTSPAIAFAWFGAICVLFLFEKRDWRRWLWAIFVALMLVFPWTVRNAITFHRFIPMKSNLMYEAYQANVVDSDGIYDESTITQHPSSSERTRFEYAKLGEIPFVEVAGERFLRKFRESPLEYFRRVANRAVATMVQYVPIEKSHGGPVELGVRKTFFALPLVAFLSSIWIKGPHSRLLIALGVFWVCYSLPYIIVATYNRYPMPLAPMMVTIVFLAADQIAWRCNRGRNKLGATGLSKSC